MCLFVVRQAQYKWTLSLEPCPNTGVGVSDNNQHEYAASSRHNEDRYKQTTIQYNPSNLI